VVEGNQASGPPPFFSSSFSAEVRLVRSTRSGTGICKLVSIAALQWHADEHVDDGDGTYIHALDGRAGRNGGAAGAKGVTGAKDVRHVPPRLHREVGDSAETHDVPKHEGLVLVLVPSTTKVMSACFVMLLWCWVARATLVRPRSLHRRQPSLTAMTAHLPAEPAKHARHVDGDGVRVRENFCVV